MICPICMENKIEIFSKKINPNLLICCECRHIFWEKSPGENDLVDYYKNSYTNNHDQLKIQMDNIQYYRGHIRELLLLLQAKPKDTAIADFGCSYPILLCEAKNAGFKRFVGVDLDRGIQEYGRSHGIQICSAEEFISGESAMSYDILRFSHALEHMRDPLSLIISAKAKLRAHGLMHITQPSFPVFFPECRDIEIEDAVFPEHLHFFSPISLCRMLTEAGLSVETIFTHTGEVERVGKYRTHIDKSYVESEMRAMQHKGRLSLGECANYPFYGGKNSVVNAFVRA